MKTAIKIFICLIGLWGGLSGCSFSETTYKELADIENKRLGILKGSLEEQQLATAYPQASVKVYDKTMGLFMDIEAGRCDVALLDEEVAIRVISRNSDYACLGIWEPLMEESWYVIVPKSKMDKEVWDGGTENSWWQGWGNRIHRNLLADNAWKLILGGLYTTVVIFFFGAILAVLLAALLTYMHINHRWMWLYRSLHWFVFTIHDIPSVVLMMFFYYVVFASVSAVNGVCVSIIALGVYSSASLTKIFTIHIEQVGKEQRESAQMLGFTPYQTYRYIVLPQALKSMLPLMIGELKLLLRSTSYAGYIAQKDLVKAVDAIRTQTFDAFVPLMFISLLYLGLSWMIARLVKMLSLKLFHHD